IILLSGSVRTSDLGRAVQRSMLDLPVDGQRTVMGLWHAAADELATALGMDSLAVRAVTDASSPFQPTPPAASGRAVVTVEREPAEFRGTGGLLRDLARSYGPDDLLLVGNGAQ